MDSIENFYKNIKVEEEKKLLTTSPKDGGSLESFYKSIPSEETEKQNIVQQQDLQDLTGTQVAQDISISGTQGVAKGLTYLADLPFMLGNALNATEGFMADKIGKFIGLDEEEIKEAKQKLLIVEKGTTQYPPGGLREKYLTYKPKTTAGEYAETIGEFAAPGGLIAKGARARKIFAGTGAASGAIGETAEQLTDSGMVGTGVGVATNLALDLYALSRGNVSKIAKDILPSKKILDDAKKVEADALKYNLILKPSETTGTSAIQATEGNVGAYIAGNKILDKHWESRPQQLKNYIRSWSKDMGIISKSDSLTNTAILNQLKKAASKLTNSRTRLWKESGGSKLLDYTFDAQKVDNLGITISNLEKNVANKDLSKTVLKYADRIKNSRGNGEELHQIYREIRDIRLGFSQAPKQPGAAAYKEQELYRIMEKQVDELLSINSNYKSAQTKYKKFTKVYINPLEKNKIIKDLRKIKLTEDSDLVPQIYRLLASDKLSARDIENIARSLKKSDNGKLYQNLISSFFEESFLKASTDNINKGVNTGIVLHKAILGNSRQRANFSEMLYQLSKTRNPKVNKRDIVKSVDGFANVLLATGRKTQVGSPTAQRLEFQQKGGQNILSRILEFPPGIKIIQRYFDEQTFSKTSEKLSNAMTSEKGIDALINLSENWKDPNAAIGYLRALIISSERLN
jgi:hypothetical protein